MFKQAQRTVRALWFNRVDQAKRIASLSLTEIINELETGSKAEHSQTLCHTVDNKPTDVGMLTEQCELVTWNVVPNEEPAMVEPAPWMDQIAVYSDKQDKDKTGSKRSRRDDNRTRTDQNKDARQGDGTQKRQKNNRK